MNFSKEPIIWVGFTIAILMTVADYLNGNLSMQSLDALLVATGAVIGRNLVVPVAKYDISKQHSIDLTKKLNKFNRGE